MLQLAQNEEIEHNAITISNEMNEWKMKQKAVRKPSKITKLIKGTVISFVIGAALFATSHYFNAYGSELLFDKHDNARKLSSESVCSRQSNRVRFHPIEDEMHSITMHAYEITAINNDAIIYKNTISGKENFIYMKHIQEAFDDYNHGDQQVTVLLTNGSHRSFKVSDKILSSTRAVIRQINTLKRNEDHRQLFLERAVSSIHRRRGWEYLW